MNLIERLDDVPERLGGGALSIGNFDGVHRGHARIIQRLLAMARKVGGPAVAFTFNPHPARLLRPEAAPIPLCDVRHKAALLTELGVDAVVAYPTDRALLSLEATEFFQRIVRDRFACRGLVEGPDFHFGHDRGGNVAALKGMCAAARIALDVVEPVVIDGAVVSSSRIRRLIAEGDVEEAARLLTRPYRISGTVIHGAGRGRTIGYPTANVDSVATILPAEGIYAGRAWTEGVAWPAAISLGPNPTFNDGRLKVEVFLIGFDGDLYDRPLEIDFLARLRDIVRFTSVEQLVTEIDHDVERAREVVAKWDSTTCRTVGQAAPGTIQ